MATETVKAPQAEGPPREKRQTPRAKISLSARIRPSDPRREEEVRTTLNRSPCGLYFTTWTEHYYVGMHLRVTFPYSSSVDLCNSEQVATIARIDRLKDGRLGIAVRIL
jgi:hypothetical protein